MKFEIQNPKFEANSNTELYPLHNALLARIRFFKLLRIFNFEFRIWRLTLLWWVLVIFFVNRSHADTVLATKHDLSVAGSGTIKATIESEVCFFCHTPHRGTGQTPLWNHTLSSVTYTPYSSSTAKATIGQPTGASKLCLSCHDGTVAIGMVATRSTAIEM